MSEPEVTTTPPSDMLVEYLDKFLAGESWASTGEEAARHVREVLGYVAPALHRAEIVRLEDEGAEALAWWPRGRS